MDTVYDYQITRKSIQEEVLIPDATNCENGCKYEASVVFDNFDENAVVESVNDIAFARLKLEHSYNGDLYIGLICPNGQHANILNRYNNDYNDCTDSIPAPYSRLTSNNNGADFGMINTASNSSDRCDPATNPIGIPWNYCWSDNAIQALGYQYASENALVYESSNVHSSRIDSTNTIDMTQVYHPDQSFEALIGCQMNGAWTIEIVDAGNGDNGWVSEVELALTGVEYRQEEVLAGCVWHYNVYTESGTYTYNYYNEDDQLSTDTLQLTVYPMEFVDVVESACESYTWNNQTYTESGDYTQSFQTVHGCDSTVTLQLTITTGITENLGAEISVYPNPTRNTVFLTTNRLTIDRISVYDIYGRLLEEKAVGDKQTSVDLSAYAMGTYFIRIQTDRGVVAKKIIRER